MIIKKEIKDDNEFYLYFNGKLIYKKWLDQGYSKVFDHFAWGKYTDQSITDLDLDETPPLIHVKANLQFNPTNKSSRIGGIQSGYRPNHVFEYQSDGEFEYSFVGDIVFDGDNIIPGENRIVTVRFLTNQPIEKYLTFGQKWWIHEGQVLVGEAEILDVKFPKLD